jgi:hypothetical protein
MTSDSRIKHGHGFCSLKLTLAAAALSQLAFVATVMADPGNDPRAPELGNFQNLKAPAGHKVSYHVYADGVQVYRWNGASWSFVGPKADLYANAGGNALVGTHYTGPTWESNSGSKVVGTVLERGTPDPSAIPWLLLNAVSSEGPGVFADVTYIQRVSTVGGNAPSEAGSIQGEIVEVPYSAEYFFYRAQQ